VGSGAVREPAQEFVELLSSSGETNMWRKILKYAGLVILLFLVVAQFFQPEIANPPAPPAADFETIAKPSPEVAAIVKRSCHDCHSNKTTWPWYSQIAPVSWLIANDVKEARVRLNFSEWNRLGPDMSRIRMKGACAEVKSGGMPMWQYKIMHPAARLSDSDIQALCKSVGLF
jgi:Haem-binding domain